MLCCNRVSVLSRFRDNGPQTYGCHDLDLSRSRDVIGYVTIWFPRCHFLWVLCCNRVSISNHFRDNGHFYIWVTTLTFLGHVTSSVTWPFDFSGAISYVCSIVTESLSSTIFEIMGIFHMWITTLTFLCHVTSLVTWPFDSPGAISCRCSIVTQSLSPTIFEIIGISYLGHDLDLSRSCGVIGPWPIDPPYVISYWCPIVTKRLSLTVFEIFGPQIPCAHTHRNTDTRRKWFYILSHAMYCIGQTKMIVVFCCNLWTHQQKLHDYICSGCKNIVSQKMYGFYWATLYI